MATKDADEVGMKVRFSVIAAVDANNGIGFRGQLPWPPSKRDMAHFKAVTTNVVVPTKRNAVIMGRKTWESLPQNRRPLAQRKNIVVTSSPLHVGIGSNNNGEAGGARARAKNGNVCVASSLNHALALAAADKTVEEIFVIGGAQLFAEAISPPLFRQLNRIYLTRMKEQFECDTFFAIPPDQFDTVMWSDDGDDAEGVFVELIPRF